MILKIDKKESEAFEQACHTYSLQVQFYTMEANSNLCQVEVLDNGKEITLFEAYALGRDTGMQKMSNALIK